MKNKDTLKQELLEQCRLLVFDRRRTITNVISSAKNALVSESKSSAGDKHETGRAMLQLEMEKAGQQLENVIQMEETLDRIPNDKTLSIGCLGALIRTNKGNYFLTISVGEIIIDKISYYAISTKSPIGTQMLGKRLGDTIPFNGATITEVS